MPYLTLGILGHVDHGKTALVKALTGVDTDRLKEEKQRGISIVLGYTDLNLPEGQIGIVDAPGHERFIRTMIAGATGIDAALLVVDVNEGVKPQTVEHLDIARLLGIRNAIVALTKCDLADDEMRALARAEVGELLAETPLTGAQIIETSALTGEGIDILRAALGKLVAHAPEHIDEGDAFLPIDRAFSMSGFGTVVTGTLRRGAIRKSDTLTLYPTGRPVQVRDLQSHNRATDVAHVGRRTAVNLRGVGVHEIARGHVLASPDSVRLTTIIDVELVLLKTAAPLKNRQRVRFLTGTQEIMARLHLLDRDEIAPGETAYLQLRLDGAMPVLPRERYILRSYSPMHTIGGGRILAAAERGYRRREAGHLERLRALASGNPAAMLRHKLLATPFQPLHLKTLARELRVSDAAIRTACAMANVQVAPDGRALLADIFTAALNELHECLDQFHRDNPTLPGIPLHELSLRAPRAWQPAFLNLLVHASTERGETAIEKGMIRRANFRPGGALSPQEEETLRKLEERFRAGGLEPPEVDDVLRELSADKKLYRLLRDQGRLIQAQVPARGAVPRYVAFHADVLHDAAQRLHEQYGPTGGFATPDAKALLNASRKYLIPLLETLDARGFTRRTGDRRIFAK